MSRFRFLVLFFGMCLLYSAMGYGQPQSSDGARSGHTGASISRPVGPDSSGNGSTMVTGPQAVVPRLIKFGGVLHDGEGKPMEGTVDVTFSLYNTEAGGEALWFETQSVQADELGRYTALLGAMHTEGLPIDLFTSGQAHWLSIQVGLEAEQQPRVLLVSVPYALKAGDAETLGGKPASAYMLADPQSSSVSAGVSAKSQIKSRTASAVPLVAQCSSVTSNNGGAVNSIAMFTSSCDVESSPITQLAGNVGIGTASPGVTLDITGPSNASVQLSGPGVHQFTVSGATSGRFGQDTAGTFLSSDTNGAQLRFSTNNGGPNEWMRITSAGNVGIGTTTPVSSFNVGGTTPITWTSGGNNLGLVTIGDPATGGSLYVNTPSANTTYQSGFAVDGSYGATSLQSVINLRALGVRSGGGYGSQMAFWTSNGTTVNPGMVLDQNGNLGIGTTAPARTLDVLGGARVAGGAPSTTGEIVMIRDDLDTVHLNSAEAGSQMHFRLSRSGVVNAAKDFVIGPYTYGMEMDYAGLLEINTNTLSVKGYAPAIPGVIYLDTKDDYGSLNIKGDAIGPTLTATHYDGTSAGSIRFSVINPTDSFKFGFCTLNCADNHDSTGKYTTNFNLGTDAGGGASNFDVFNGLVQGRLRADSAGAVQLGSVSNHRLDFFTNGGGPRATLFPDGNLAIGNLLDQGMLSVGSSGQFQISSAGLVTFAPGQTFPGIGAITGITTASGSGLSGGGASGNLSLAVDSTVARTNASNSFIGNQSVTGIVSATSFTGSGAGLTNLTATNLSAGTVGIGTSAPISGLNVAGTTPISWASAGNSLGLVTIGDPVTGGSLFVKTPSLSPGFQSGFAVDGSFVSEQQSVINLRALGVKSTGGYGSQMAFWTSNDTAANQAMLLDQNGNLGVRTSAPISSLNVGGSTPIAWTSGGNNLGLVTIGDPATGGSFYVNTPSANTVFQSGFAVDGSYGSPAQQSVINLRALGVKSGGGYGSQMAFWTSNGTTMNPVMVLDMNGNVRASGAVSALSASLSGALSVGGGTPITQHISTTAVLSFAIFSGLSCNEAVISAPGAQDGDTVALGIPSALAALPGISWSGWVNGSGVVKVRGCNATVNSTGTPPAATVRVDVWRH